MKITAQKGFTVNESDRLQLITLLAKHGYTVRRFSEKAEGKKTNVIGVEFWVGGSEIRE